MSAILPTPRSARWLTRATVACAALIAGSTLAPTAAEASTPSPVSSVTWNLRTSWVDYLTNPAWYGYTGQGSVAVTSSNGGTSTAGSPDTSWSFGIGFTPTNYAYDYAFDVASDSGSPRTVVLEGGLDFDMSAHSIDISLSDLKIQDNSSGPEQLLVDASYVPVGGTEQHLYDTAAFEISETATSGLYTVTLTEDGAEIFNGGSNGSYAEGDAFGSVAFS
ncbi:MAG: HtaA domain-containing protein [Nocardioides sp.]|uniref:HtaA domain-containing protein n=1 Tax=Nocardioides sp. TaxID=35761 RepID=UPI0039E6F34E